MIQTFGAEEALGRLYRAGFSAPDFGNDAVAPSVRLGVQMKNFASGMLAVLTALVLGACADVSAEKMMTSVEAITAHLALKGLPEDAIDKDLIEAVEQLSKNRYDKSEKVVNPPVEAKLSSALADPNISELKKAVLTYELARTQMCQEKYSEAGRSYKNAENMVASMGSQRSGLLGAVYYSYMTSLELSGNSEEARVYRVKYDELAATRKNRSSDSP